MKIPLHKPNWDEEEIQAVVEVMRSGQVTLGNRVREFEARFGEHAIMVNTGSSANLLAAAMLCNPAYPEHFKPGDEVIVSALSWSTTVWPWVQHGIVPVLVDINPDTLNIDPVEILKAYSSKTRAIMPVHVYGNPCEMNEINQIATDLDLFVVDDCCEALGADFKAHGNLSTYSFYFSHHITALHGGMIVAENNKQADLLRVLRGYGWIREMKAPVYYEGIDPKFTFINAGYNLMPPETSAAMGLVQMKKLDQFVKTRREIAQCLMEIFKPYSIKHQKDAGGSSWFGFSLVAERALRDHFEAEGIETRPIICGNIARQPGMKLWPHRVVGDLSNANHVMDHWFAIPCNQGMTMEDCNYIAASLKRFYE